MSRQLDVQIEQRTAARHDALVRALEYGLDGAAQSNGYVMLGYAFTFDQFSCQMVLKAEIDNVRQVAFIYSDSVIGCILKAWTGATNARLKWGVDKYFKDED